MVDAGAVDPTQSRLLRRTGTVVDTGGLDLDEASRAISAERVDGILTLADECLGPCAELAERLGLAFHSPATAARLVDKLEQRRALRAAGLPTPGCVALHVPVRAHERHELESIAFPAVCKPRIGEASRDTVLVTGPAELDALLHEHAAAERGTAERELVVEEYIPDATRPLAGEGFAGYVSVESVAKDGHLVHLAVNGRTPPAPPFRETGFFIPSTLGGALRDQVLAVAADAAIALGVERGCLHTEIKLTDDGPVVIEVNGRIGGGVPEMLASACGVDLLGLAFDLAVGRDLPEFLAVPLPCDRVSFLMYVHAPREVTTLRSIEGLDAVRALPGVEEVVLRRAPGDPVDWREGNHGHVATVFGAVADHDALRATLAAVNARLVIRGA